MKTCRSLIMSRIDYGCIKYNSTSSRELESLTFVSNEVMRISSGCLKCTPISSLEVITEQPLLHYRVKISLRNPAFKFIAQEQETLFANKSSLPPVRNHNLKKNHTKVNLENRSVTPDLSHYRLHMKKKPKWGLPSTRINFSLTYLP